MFLQTSMYIFLQNLELKFLFSGQRLQIQTYPDRVQNPQVGQILQNKSCPPSHMEIRVRHCLSPRRLNYFKIETVFNLTHILFYCF